MSETTDTFTDARGRHYIAGCEVPEAVARRFEEQRHGMLDELLDALGRNWARAISPAEAWADALRRVRALAVEYGRREGRPSTNEGSEG